MSSNIRKYLKGEETTNRYLEKLLKVRSLERELKEARVELSSMEEQFQELSQIRGQDKKIRNGQIWRLKSGDTSFFCLANGEEKALEKTCKAIRKTFQGERRKVGES